MNITILNVSLETKTGKNGKPYQQADIAFKNNTFGGKVEGKKMLGFGAQAEAFKVIAAAQPGDIFDVTVNKNDQGYNDWVSVSKALPGTGPKENASVSPAVRGGTSTATRGYVPETPEERAKKQVYIVRQSSIGSAVDALSVGAKSAPTAEAVIAYAKKLEQYVFDAGTGFDDVPTLDPSFIAADPQIE